MLDRQLRCSRRKFLASAAALTLGAGVATGHAAELSPARSGQPSTQGRKPLAVITTVYRPLSHSYHIAGRFLHGYTLAGKLHVPKHYVHSLYVDQTAGQRPVARRRPRRSASASRAPSPTP